MVAWYVRMHPALIEGVQSMHEVCMKNGILESLIVLSLCISHLMANDYNYYHQKLAPTFPGIDSCLLVTKWDFLEWKCHYD